MDMGSIELQFSSKWDYSFKADITGFKGLLAKALKETLQDVSADMQETLKKHIDADVYEKYYPSEYRRRSKNADLGRPLNDLKANVFSPVTEADVINTTVFGQTRFQYLPTGEHTVKKWSSAAVQNNPNFPINVDGNALISRIEKKEPPYNWGNNKVPKRPFWKNTVDELIDGGAAASSFDRWMQIHGGVLEYEPGAVAEWEPGDGEY